ncbi:threonine transporter RhtB [Massilia violaceinigra]|uniref:Threonine transporter RhtB n=1 Tax=Massilia violaceinigra TaxID=2045208 RepID=A0A2D2DQ05_9BURK|nr:LysE family translocator [Massilia violaceinigra]ATQ77064.1 threonine transporter RhtB [Massilia violaceinigra]
MNEATNLWLYFVVVFGIIALPGLDMAFVMGSALLGGRRAGLAAVAGIVSGGFCHLAMGALGAAAVLALWPALFNAMLGVGALYTAWIGLSFLRSSAQGTARLPGAACTTGATFRRALGTSLLNPKAYLFMLAIFPQFLHPGPQPLWAQSAVLGAITALTQAGVYGALALLSGGAGGWLERRPAAALLLARTMGLLLIGVAALTAFQLVRKLPPAETGGMGGKIATKMMLT